MTAQIVGNILLWLSAVPAVAAIVVYAFTNRPARGRVGWWQSSWGRHLFTYMATVGLVLGLAVLRSFIGDSELFRDVRVASFASVTVALWWRFALVVQAARQGPYDDTAAAEQDKLTPPEGRRYTPQ